MAQNLQLPFADVRLYGDDIITGTAGGPEFATNVTINHGGYEQRNANWDMPLGRWDIGQRGYCQTTKDYLISFFRQRRGKFQGFLWRDLADWQATATPLLSEQGFTTQGLVVFEPGASVGQLIKRYSDGFFAADRAILKPESGTLVLPPGYTLGQLGKVTLSSAPNAALVELPVSFNFFVPVRFETDNLRYNLQSTEGAPQYPGYEAIFYVDTLPIVEVRGGFRAEVVTPLIFNSQLALSCANVTQSGSFYMTLVIDPADPTGTYTVRDGEGAVVSMYLPNGSHPVSHIQGDASEQSSPNTNFTGFNNIYIDALGSNVGDAWTLTHEDSGTVVATSSVPLCTFAKSLAWLSNSYEEYDPANPWVITGVFDPANAGIASSVGFGVTLYFNIFEGYTPDCTITFSQAGATWTVSYDSAANLGRVEIPASTFANNANASTLDILLKINGVDQGSLTATLVDAQYTYDTAQWLAYSPS